MRQFVLTSMRNSTVKRPLHGLWWQGVAFALVLALVFVLMGAPWWAAVLLLLMGAVAARVWFQRDVVQAEQPWQNWVPGWYWETDAEHRIVRWQAGRLQSDTLSIDWDQLAAWTALHPTLWSCWADGADAAGVARLRYCLAHHQPLPGELTLPWPSALSFITGTGGAPLAGVWQGSPVYSQQGDFTGFQGVFLVNPVVDAAHSAGQVSSAASDPGVREAEQEALRYALSHDLRAPLRVVDGFARIVKEDYGSALGKMGNDHLDRILAASTRMSSMIDAILAQAQLAGTHIDRVEVDLSALAHEIGQELLAQPVTGERPELIVADGLTACADASLVRRVLENLIGNAFKYSAKVVSPRVEVGVMPSTNPPVFYVRDNGAGFDMQHADKLFGMFQRLHSAKEFPGTGVGLAGVQNIIRRHGGRVWAEAKPGDGACFYFTLMDSSDAQKRSA